MVSTNLRPLDIPGASTEWSDHVLLLYSASSLDPARAVAEAAGGRSEAFLKKRGATTTDPPTRDRDHQPIYDQHSGRCFIDGGRNADARGRRLAACEPTEITGCESTEITGIRDGAIKEPQPEEP